MWLITVTQVPLEKQTVHTARNASTNNATVKKLHFYMTLYLNFLRLSKLWTLDGKDLSPGKMDLWTIGSQRLQIKSIGNFSGRFWPTPAVSVQRAAQCCLAHQSVRRQAEKIQKQKNKAHIWQWDIWESTVVCLMSHTTHSLPRYQIK